jgi:hypothetical protein
MAHFEASPAAWVTSRPRASALPAWGGKGWGGKGG